MLFGNGFLDDPAIGVRQHIRKYRIRIAFFFVLIRVGKDGAGVIVDAKEDSVITK